ncbi:MAG TPA: tRNA preQ1(34) S-adenosylmethionine ribosyltransferase-isomerase QueA, partial [Longilinea sp.]|nr:tRNA preQ1(34) S-adenosylmethionine ribosyltransferase-isomerase QueA [Longilinea sp.]
RTRVIPARIFARKPTGGRVEILLLKKREANTWEALVGGKKMQPGTTAQVEGGPQVEVIESLEGSQRLVTFSEPIDPFLANIGQMPLPPYIHEKLQNPERYQTVFSRDPGSAAAPTAGLHFTPQLMDDLRGRGVAFVDVTLHVGLDTFAPVTEDDPEQHQIHTEWCEVTPEAAQKIRTAKGNGGRIIAIGTTSVRTLESAARSAKPEEIILPIQQATDLFILPGFHFKVVDAMVTNFHLPRSTLLMLVSAFAGREKILAAYEEAVRQEYRFYSFGDAMLIL